MKMFTSDLPWCYVIPKIVRVAYYLWLYLLCNQIRGSTMLLYQIFQRLKMFTSDLPCSPVISPDDTCYTCCATKFEEVPYFCTKYSRDRKCSPSDLPWCHMSWHRLHGFQLLNVSVSTAQSSVLSLSLSNSLSLLSIRPSVCLSLSD